MPPPHSNSSWKTSLPSDERERAPLAQGANAGGCHRDSPDGEAPPPPAGRARPSRRGEPRPGRARPALGTRRAAHRAEPVRPCGPPAACPLARANSTARSAASRAPTSSSRRSHAKPQAPSTSTRTPIPAVSASSTESTRPFRVETDCERRVDGAGVGIAGTRADRNVDSPGAERSHRASLSSATRRAVSLPGGRRAGTARTGSTARSGSS